MQGGTFGVLLDGVKADNTQSGRPSLRYLSAQIDCVFIACETSRDPFAEGGPGTELTGECSARRGFGGAPVLGCSTGLAVPSPSIERLAPATQVRRLPTV